MAALGRKKTIAGVKTVLVELDREDLKFILEYLEEPPNPDFSNSESRRTDKGIELAATLREKTGVKSDA